LGTKEINNTILNKQSIGIELCSWGALTFKLGKYYNVMNHEVPKENVVSYLHPFNEVKYFEKYTVKQLDSLRNLLKYLCLTYNIPKSYNFDMWQISRSALSGNQGIYTHLSFRRDKSDCHPQKELVELLKNL
jgi:hypothetical protein